MPLRFSTHVDGHPAAVIHTAHLVSAPLIATAIARLLADTDPADRTRVLADLTKPAVEREVRAVLGFLGDSWHDDWADDLPGGRGGDAARECWETAVDYTRLLWPTEAAKLTHRPPSEQAADHATRRQGVVGLIATDPDVAASCAVYVALTSLYGTAAEHADALRNLTEGLGPLRAESLVRAAHAAEFGSMEKPEWWDRRHDRRDTT